MLIIPTSDLQKGIIANDINEGMVQDAGAGIPAGFGESVVDREKSHPDVGESAESFHPMKGDGVAVVVTARQGSQKNVRSAKSDEGKLGPAWAGV